MNEYQVSNEEKEFLIKNCPVRINKKSFKRYWKYNIDIIIVFLRKINPDMAQTFEWLQKKGLVFVYKTCPFK